MKSEIKQDADGGVGIHPLVITVVFFELKSRNICCGYDGSPLLGVSVYNFEGKHWFSDHVVPLYIYFTEQANMSLRLKLHFSSFHFHFPPVLS